MFDDEHQVVGFADLTKEEPVMEKLFDATVFLSVMSPVLPVVMRFGQVMS